MRKNKEILANVGDTEVLVDRIGLSWIDPFLIMRVHGREVDITTDAGEFNNDFGEFVIDNDKFTDYELTELKEVLDEIADKNSFLHFEDIGFFKFTLKEDYLNKLEEFSD